MNASICNYTKIISDKDTGRGRDRENKLCKIFYYTITNMQNAYSTNHSILKKFPMQVFGGNNNQNYAWLLNEMHAVFACVRSFDSEVFGGHILKWATSS